MDSNHRSRRRQIYSLIHLAALESAHIFNFCCGAGDWTRTHNLLITNQLLCQLSYTGMWCFWHLFSCRNDFSRRFYFRNLSRTSSATNSLFTRALICYGFRFCHILVQAIFTPSRKTPKIRLFPRYPLYHTQRITLWVLCWVWCLGAESNHRQADFQSAALPTELPRHMWRPKTGSNRRPPA